MDSIIANTIEKDPVLTHHDEDYAYLRQAGLEYIEELGSKFWTDYNEHDPGITILEALCYAITELGYRSSLPMQDLLTNEDGKTADGQVLYTPKQVLTQAPLTEDDYRKLLIDIVGVHNAWIFYGDYDRDNNVLTPIPQEVPIYADCLKDKLVFNQTAHPISLFGLYKVLVDLDTDAQLGDLNNGELQADTPKTNSFAAGAASLSFIFPAWNQVTDETVFTVNVGEVTTVKPFVVTASGNNWNVAMSYTWNATEYDVNCIVSVDLQPVARPIVIADINDFFSSQAFRAMIIGLYLMKIQKAKKILDDCARTLMANRNLCEDFINIDTVREEEIAICCDIDVAPGADMESIQAQVYLAIENYFNPGVKFYLLSEMMNKYPVDEIFEGPRLTHGFIDTGELEKTQLRQYIHASDIISAIMAIVGVTAVRNIRMTKYGINGVVVSGKEWCLDVTTWCKPVLSETKSKIVFYKNRFPYLASVKEVRDIMRWLKSVAAGNKLNGYEDDLQVPAGTYFPVGDYSSIQTLFPLTYGIGNAGLPSTASVDRFAQANQLRAYLLFYDQLFADFFAQLQNAKDLFSVKDLSQTYYATFIDNLKGLETVYKNRGADLLLKSVIADHNSANGSLPPSDWQRLYESEETYLDRRNRFLDHLMARFAESFNDYVFLMYSLDYETQQETRIDPKDIIATKINFLKDYPEISYSRGLAFNYFPEKFDTAKKEYIVDTAEFWNTDNVSGLEKKLCLLGAFKNPGGAGNIQSYYRRFLYCLGKFTTVAGIIDTTKLRFVFTAGANTLTSVKEYKDLADINNDLPQFLSLAMA